VERSRGRRMTGKPVLVNNVGGYFANSKPKRSSERSYDAAAATRLWQVSANLVGLTTAHSV